METIQKEKPFTFRKNGKTVIVNSTLENIDTLTEEELKEALTRFKLFLSPIMTSMYIPSIETMKLIHKYAPDMKIRMKLEETGGSPILPITTKEFFEGEAYFSQILSGVKQEWTELQKYKYLYNQLGLLLSYDSNLFPDKNFSSMNEEYARNIFTSITYNLGVCTSFATSYDYLCYRCGLESQVISDDGHAYVIISPTGLGDYLTDCTFDSTDLKFGRPTKNFGVSKEQFKKNGHYLDQTEYYQIKTLDEKQITNLDQTTGYLDLFGGFYQEEKIKEITKNLIGNTIFEKVAFLLEQVTMLLAVGRPTASDYELLLKELLMNSKDLQDVNIHNTLLEASNQNSRVIILEVRENGVVKYYQFGNSQHKVRS